MIACAPVARRPSRTAEKAKPPKRRRPGRPPKHETDDVEARFPDAHVIKRYGNRRLYDAKNSKAITLEGIAELVRRGEKVLVVDGDNGDDITRRVLVQILLESQQARVLEMMPVELLRKLISVREGPVAKWMEAYLNAGSRFAEKLSAGGPIQGTMEQLLPWMRAESWMPFDAGAAGATPAPPSGAEGAKDEELRDEMEELQRRMADLTARVNRRS
jgi:polyhydroxyalkanoate synthesis repressor PhaR